MNDIVVKIAIIDDHILFRKGFSALINTLGNKYKINIEAADGLDLQKQIEGLSEENIPKIALLDINMPNMDGYETAKWLKQNVPDIKILALTTQDDDASLMQMVRNGAVGYLLKDTHPEELLYALDMLQSQGYYYNKVMSGRILSNVNKFTDDEPVALSQREIDILEAFCSDLTVKEIAEKFFLSPRTIDAHRERLFEKLGVKTRYGLMIYAIKNNIVKL